jgi:hypothetical protein
MMTSGVAKQAVQMLLDAAAEPDEQNDDGDTPLHMYAGPLGGYHASMAIDIVCPGYSAVEMRDRETVELLMAAKVSVNAKSFRIDEYHSQV